MGTQSDDRSGCVVVENGRRKGVCEDGMYSFDIQATDAAGNASDIRYGVRVERDTVRPERPGVELYKIGNTIRARVKGEPDSFVISNGTPIGKIDGDDDVILLTGTCGQTYSLEVSVQDRAGNQSESVTNSISTSPCPRIIGENNNLLGTPEDQFGGIDGSALGQASMEITVFITESGEKIEYVNRHFIPMPRITYIDINDDQSEFTVYGVSIPKNHKTKFKVMLREPYESKCKLLFVSYNCTKYKTSEQEFEDELEHVGVAVYQQRSWYEKMLSGDLGIGWLWMDNTKWSDQGCSSESNGRWQCTLPLDDKDKYDLNINDKIFARTKVWGNTAVDGENASYIVSYSDNADSFWSGKTVQSEKSNVEEIKDTEIESLKKILLEMNISVEDNDKARWKANDLYNLIEAFTVTPKKFFTTESGVFTVQKEESSADNESGCKVNEENGVETSHVSAYVSSVIENTFVVCSRMNSNSSYDTYYIATVLHELTHNYQKLISGNDIKYGLSSPNNTELSEYYEILFDWDGIEWVSDMYILDESIIPACIDYGKSMDTELPEGDYFVSWYQCVTSYRPEDIGANKVMPEEEMAESYSTYLLNISRLQTQDTYSFFRNNQSISGDLRRDDFLSRSI